MKTRYLKLIFTHHAINRLYNRGLSQADVWEVFQHPDGQKPGIVLGSIKFYKNYGSQRLEVVAKKNERGEWVVLSCWSRQPGPGQSARQQSSATLGNNFLERLIMKGLNKMGRLFKN
ncbi:hypothetical protein COT66_01300 [Candidatus Shapirobacteria bacterium CG09_land_8_20_14_0_10_49_15]|uniref:DUF4258 domain-containing protein n=1 Tax=Candidatus Shapirobacteria bacterium CG09_land_8_20_14_0_10_49_15 TaxID=1974482 RepID=A0A2M6XB70_9BACT|nr:MAG: hypothetical protein COT66_01300 [Candidatus Shapirobacteria bacterium CG09_land_8_20_14_0_10_49_15]